jgi:3-phenylpropionate/cinnamic acid dioxygenase small subunit
VNVQRDEIRPSHGCLLAEWVIRVQETAYPKLQPHTSYIFNRTHDGVFERISRVVCRNDA